MTTSTKDHILVRLAFLRDTIPTADRRRTARGRVRTWRQLDEYRERASQLYAYAATEDERQPIDDLVAEIDAQQEELADGGALFEKAKAEWLERTLRTRRPRRPRGIRRANWARSGRARR